MLTFRILGYAIALSWLLILKVDHVSGSFPLPNPIESPHLKNQRVVSCLSEYDPTMFIKGTPNKPSCHDSVFVNASLTPTDDVLSVACYGKVYLDGELLVSNSIANACVGVKQVKCPILKRRLQKFNFKDFLIPCTMSKGHYKIMGHCINQNDKMIFCLEWTFLWV